MNTTARVATVLSAAALLWACTPPPNTTQRPTNNNGNTTNGPTDSPTSNNPSDFAYPDYDLAPAYTPDSGVVTGPACGSVTELGDCVGSSARFCDSGTLQIEDCAATGATCMVDQYGAYCSGGTGGTTGGGSCGSVTADGTCSGNTLSFCNDMSQIETVDCTPYGGCTVDATGFADCKNPPSN
jgi:hypothetical protein